MTSYALNRDKAITQALKIVGALDENETPSAQQLTDASVALNSIITAWRAEGLQSWNVVKKDLTITAGTDTYSMLAAFGFTSDNFPMRFYEVTINISPDLHIPIDQISRDTFYRIVNHTTLGRPTQFYYERGTNDGTIRFWTNPDINYSVSFVYQEPQTAPQSGTDIIDFPDEFLLAIQYTLAADLCDFYGVPDRKAERIQQKAMMYAKKAFDYMDEDTSIFFHKDYRYQSLRGWH